MKKWQFSDLKNSPKYLHELNDGVNVPFNQTETVKIIF